MKKILLSLLIIFSIISICTLSMCTSIDLNTYTGAPSNAADKIEAKANQIIGIVQIIATTIAVIMLIWLGVKYVSAAPSEKADIKKSSIIYVVGATLLFATTGILQLIKLFADGLNK